MLRFSARGSVLAFLLLLASISAYAQYAELDGAAEQVAEKLQSPVPHMLAVATFTTQDGSPSVEGAYLASVLSSAIQVHGKNSILVRDHAAFVETLAKEKLSPVDLCLSEPLKRLPIQFSIDVLLLGSIEVSPDRYTIQIKTVHVPGGTILDTQRISFRKTKFLDSLTAPFPPKIQFPIYTPGLNGISQPVCQYCPNPSPADYATRDKIHGQSVIEVLISPEGSVVDYHPLKLLGYGLDEEFTKNVKEWKFKPAARPDGTPVYAITQVEIQFSSN